MSRRPRQNHSPAFKAKVPLAGVKGGNTLAELGQFYYVHPNQIWYQFAKDCRAVRPHCHLSGFRGWMHADRYSGYEALHRSGQLRRVACIDHIRWKFVDIAKAQALPMSNR